MKLLFQCIAATILLLNTFDSFSASFHLPTARPLSLFEHSDSAHSGNPAPKEEVARVDRRCSSPRLPERIIVGYANWNQCDEKILQAVKDGVNVVIWFSINIAKGSVTGLPLITNGPDMDCVASMTKTIRDLNLETVHLISIGGWNSPHPDLSNSLDDIYRAFDAWNRKHIARPELGFHGFDGFDWDLEGNDDVGSKYNTFEAATLDFMGQFSQRAKKDGYIVAMAPAESYLDPFTSQFSRKLLFTYPEWSALQPDFAYHGRNCYAYLLSRYGMTTIHDESEGSEIEKEIEKGVETFDFVTLQLYEGYSRALYRIHYDDITPQSTETYLCQLVQMMNIGWEVDFSVDSELGYPVRDRISVPPSKLVLGLANGWAGGKDGKGKFLLLDTTEV